MKVVLLGGQSPQNKDWILDISKELVKRGVENVWIDYEHWKDSSREYNIDGEISKLVETKECIVFAKSLGTIITLKAIADGVISPVRCVFFGFPYDFAKTERKLDLDDWMSKVTCKIRIFQKTTDPFGSYERIKELENKNFEVNEYKREGEPVDNHHYADVSYICDLIEGKL